MKTLKSKNRIETVLNGTSIPVKEVTIKAPNFQTALFHIKGTAPLVIKRFNGKGDFIKTYSEGKKKGASKKVHAAADLNEVAKACRYVSKEGWDGFHASSIRCAMIRVCSLVDFKMTLAKMSVFVKADGVDKTEPQIPLVRIYGDWIRQDDMGRLPNGSSCLITRAAYHDWSAKLNIRWDADQFSLSDVTNLLMRVGIQCGIGEGRPFSKESAGMGWGTFEIVK